MGASTPTNLTEKPMPIHHSITKKAAKFGVQLEDLPGSIPTTVRAFWPERGQEIFGASAQQALLQMEFAQRIKREGEYKIEPYQHDRCLVVVTNADGDYLAGGPYIPQEAFKIIEGGIASWVEQPGDAQPEQYTGDPVAQGIADPIDSKIERINGIAIDGGVAYREGTSAADCPYSSEDEETDEDGDETDEKIGSTEYANFVRWNEEWDAAADEHEEEGSKEGGSVVAQKYRAKYAEAGHPTHCGDWLAETLNEIVLNKEGVNLELFEHICSLNGVDTSKYKRFGVGWQGRIRMTGRNLLAKRVYLNKGVLILPETLNGGKMIAPGDWMQTQRFKMPKSEQEKPVITIATK